MEKNSGLDKLFFELANESRLAVLGELSKEKIKMQEIARRIDVTATEASRQLERLSKALLVQRLPEGTFTLTEFGRLLLQLVTSLEFANKYKTYFSTHDLSKIPVQFQNRMGELAKSELITDTIKILNAGESAYIDMDQYGFGMAEGTIPQNMLSIMDEKIEKGIKLKFIVPEKRYSENTSAGEIKNIEARSLPELPAIIIVTEKTAGICFNQIGGKVDYAGFFGTDCAFLKWTEELFLYYWSKAKNE
ncbi:MAG: helix-turn-helix domain-containing protein [Crenarchaeota archaeon]|nr:helix-turn-helix domain-containing protein [Thermoproteota archaeon]